MIGTVLALVLSLGLTTDVAAAASGRSAQAARPADSSFMMMAARAGHAEVALADLAGRKSTDADVKAMAEKLKADHEKMNADLEALATKMRVTLPTDLTPQQKDAANRLGKLLGAPFDKAYLETTVNDHQEALKLFTQAGKNTTGDVKAFIDQALPILTDHLRQAVTLQKRLDQAQ